MMILEEVLQFIHGEFACIADEQRYEFSNKEDLMESKLYKAYAVTSIKAENNLVVLELQPWQPPVTDMDSEWVKAHKELHGSEPSFF